MKHIIHSIFVILISIFMVFMFASCSMSVNPGHETENNNDVFQNCTDNESTREIMGETTENPEKQNQGEEHNQGCGHEGDELYPIYTPMAGILSTTPGDGTFMSTKPAEVAEVCDEYMQKYAESRSTLPPLVYYVIHELNLTREEVEYYYRDKNVSTDFIDALFVDDVETAKKLLKSPYAFQIGENIYNIYEIQQMAADKNIPDELHAYMHTDDFSEVMENIRDYLDEVDPLRSRYDANVCSFVESFAVQNTVK